jgi:LysM repeat protein
MLRKYPIRYGAALLLCLAFVLLMTATKFEVNTQAQSSTVSRNDLILAMNTLRVSLGNPALIEDPIINSVAQSTAEIMAANNMSWHIGDVRGRIAAAGYGGGATVWGTENFAVGFMSIDEIMQVWADPDHMLPATTPAYCHVGAGVAQSAEGRYYYVLQAAYISGQACGKYTASPGSSGSSSPANLGVSQVIIPVKIATQDADGRIYHIVKSGQSFWSIAIAYQVTIHDLEVWNNLSRDIALWVGQELFIPSVGTEGYATPTPVGMVQLAKPDSDGKIVHEVQPYQVLIKIAKAYDVSLDRILALNGWQADWSLQIGQKLLIDPGNVTPSPTPRPLTAIEKLTPASDGNYYHTVQSGEYLAYIADLYEVSLTDLMAWNGLGVDSIIRPDQQLLLLVTPPATITSTTAAPSPTPTHTSTQPAPTPATPTAALLDVSVTSEAVDKTGFSGIKVSLAIALCIAGVVAVGWVISRWRGTGGGDEGEKKA